MHVHWQNSDLERCDGVWPYNAAIVKVLLNSGSHHASHPDTVAAHGQNLITAIFTLNGSFHRFRILGTQLEDVAHFDTAFDHQRTFAVRARVAGDYVTDVSNFRGSYVTIPVNTKIVFTIDIGAGGKITHYRNGTVDNHRNRHVHRTKRTWTCFHDGTDFFFSSKGQRAGNLRQFFCFDFVQFVIAANQQRNQRVAAAFNRFHQQGFNGFFNWQIKLLNQFRDSFRIRCVNQRHFLSGGCTGFFRRNGFSKFDVGSKIRAVGEHHVIFAALCQHLELVRGATADRAGIRLYCAEIQAHTAEDFAVRSIHRVISFLQRFLRSMERVRIFHQEFAGTHHAEAWANFVTEFGLDLIEVQRQLFVRAQLITDQVGDDFFMRWAEYE